MPNDENAARADSDKQDAVIIDAQLLRKLHQKENPILSITLWMGFSFFQGNIYPSLT